MRPEPVAPIAQAAAAASLGARDRDRLRAGAEARLDPGRDGLALRTPWTAVAVDVSLAAAAVSLIEGRETRLDALEGPPDAVAEFVRTLLVRGVLVPAS
jgi:hypothetical protein